MEVPAGQINIRGSLPCSANNVLEPMLHLAVHTGLFPFKSVFDTYENKLATEAGLTVN